MDSDSELTLAPDVRSPAAQAAGSSSAAQPLSGGDGTELTLSGGPQRIGKPAVAVAPKGEAAPSVHMFNGPEQPALVRNWRDKVVSDPEFLGFTDGDFGGTPPHWADVKAAFDARKKSLEGWNRVNEPEKQDAAASTLPTPRWQTLTRELETEQAYKKSFVVRVRDEMEQRKRIRLRKLVTDYVATDRELQYYEYMSAQGLGRDLGIPKAEVEAIVDEVCKLHDAVKQTSRERSPFKRLRSAPTRLEQLPVAIVDDFVAARSLFEAGHMAVLLDQWSEEESAFLEDAKRAEKDFRELKADEKESAIWEFVWRLGYTQLHLRFGTPEVVRTVADIPSFVAAIDADPARIVPAFRNRQAERWFLHVAGRQDLETWTKKARERVNAVSKAEGDVAALDSCLRLLWKTGEEKRLRVGSEAVTTIEGLVALDFRAARFGSLAPLWKRDLIVPWLEDAIHDDERAVRLLDVRKGWGEDVLGTWAALYALGYRKLHLASQDVEQPNDLKRIGPEGWHDLIAPMMDQRLAAWLKEAFKSDIASDLGTVRKKTNDTVAVQELLWRLGDARLRLENEDATFSDMATPADLITAFKGGKSAHLLAALKDGRLGKWVSEIVTDADYRPLARDVIQSELSDDQKILSLLWLAGMNDLPVRKEDVAGPTSVADLIAWVDSASVSSEAVRRKALAKRHASGTLGLWLRVAQDRSDLDAAIEALDAKDEHAAEDLLVAMGAEQPILTMTPETTTFTAVQEGDSREFELTLHADGSRGYLYGIIEGLDPRLDLVKSEDRALNIRAGATRTIAVRATIPAGKHLSAETLSIGCQTNSTVEDPVSSVIVTTVFPWKVITRYAMFGALIGAVVMMLLRGWLEITLIQPLGLPSLIGASQFVGEIGFWRLLLVGLFPGALIMGAAFWLRAKRRGPAALSAED